MPPFDSEFLRAAILIASPLILVALGELISEIAGVFNIGLEGMMLVGAFAGFWAGGELGNPWLAVLVGVLAGVLLAVIMAFASIQAGADQIVVGVALNILGAGLSAFAFQKYSQNQPDLFIDRMPRLEIPGLKEIPVIGPALFSQIPLVYIALLMVPVVWVLFYKTTWGLRMRAAGELPEADETAGVSVRALRWQGVLIAGAFAGLGGAFLSIGLVGTFLDGMTAGRGFLALAAVIVGGWRPLGVAAAAALFGAADALQLRLQAETFVPRSVWIVLGALILGFIVQRLTLERRRPAFLAAEHRVFTPELTVALVCVRGRVPAGDLRARGEPAVAAVAGVPLRPHDRRAGRPHRQGPPTRGAGHPVRPGRLGAGSIVARRSGGAPRDSGFRPTPE